MFDPQDRDLVATIAQMQIEALDRCRYDQVEAAERMKSWIKQDRRYDGYDPSRIVNKAHEARQTGGVFNLDDCKRGAPSRDTWSKPPVTR